MSIQKRAKLVPWIASFAILVLVAILAVPSLAAPTGTKYYMFSVSPTSVTSGQQGALLKVSITNTNPKSSSSNISSAAIVVPSQFTISSTQPPYIDASSTNGDNSAARIVVNASGSHDCTAGSGTQVSVCGIAPVKGQKTVVVGIYVNVTSVNLACGDSSSGAWTTVANTGSQLNGDNFVLDPVKQPAGDVTTTISKTCPLDWATAPSDGMVGTNQTVTVAAYTGDNPAVVDTNFNGTITINVPTKPIGSNLTVTPLTTSAVNGQQSFTLNGNTAGSYTITASASGKADAPSRSFTLYANDSSISGQVWRDHNNNGSKESDESGQGGWYVKAFNSAGQQVTSTTSSTASATLGNYTLNNLTSSSTYTVCEFAPAEDAATSYRGWFQSLPGSTTSCTGFAGQAPSGFVVQPNGYSVTLSGPGTQAVGDKDFLNVRTITVPGNTITVQCDPLPEDPYTFTVGDGVNEPLASVTFTQASCKPGEYVFESWVDTNGDQKVEFYPLDPSSSTKIQVTQNMTWVVDGDKSQRTLYYDDGAGLRSMLFCDVDSNGDYTGMPDPVAPDTTPHTTCLLNTKEVATSVGVNRLDTIVTIVDGKTLLK